MSQNVPPSTQIRLPKIKHGLLSKHTIKQIATVCHVSEKTIDRDLRKWYGTDDFRNWLYELWVKLTRTIDDEVVFKEATRLMVKDIATKIEAKQEIKIEETKRFNIDLLTENERQTLLHAISVLEKTEKPTEMSVKSRKIH